MHTAVRPSATLVLFPLLLKLTIPLYLFPGNKLAVKTHRQSVGASFHRRLMGKVRVGVPILVTAAPFVHSQRVGDIYTLLELSPAHAGARVTSQTPTNDYSRTS